MYKKEKENINFNTRIKKNKTMSHKHFVYQDY